MDKVQQVKAKLEEIVMEPKIPEKIYVTEGMLFMTNPEITLRGSGNKIEYTRTDVFIEEACIKLKKLMYDNLMFQGRLHREEIIENFVGEFRKYIEEKQWI